MNTNVFSPKAHALIDYGLTASLLILPSLLGFPKPVRRLYAAQGLVLMGYVACTEQPAALLPKIPFKLHGKIDIFNVTQFATQTFLKPFKKDKKVQLFNALFTLAAGIVVAFTDYNGRTEPIRDGKQADALRAARALS